MSKNTRLTLIIYCLTAMTIPLQFVFKAYLTQHIALIDAGIFFGLFGLVALTGIYADHGYREMLMHYIPKYISHNQRAKLRGLVRISLLSQLVGSVIVSVLLIVFVESVFTYVCHTNCSYTLAYTKNIIYGFALFQFLSSVAGSLESLVLGLGKSHLSKICEIIRLGNFSLIILILYQRGLLHLDMLTYAITIVPFFVIIFLTIYLYLYHKSFFVGERDFGVRDDVRGPLGNSFLISHAIGLYSLIDVVLVQSLVGGGSPAFYTNAILMTNGYIFVVSSIAPFVGSKISFFHHEISIEKMGDFLSKVFSLILIISLLGWGGLMVVLWPASQLIHASLSSNIYPIAVILGIGSIFGALLQFLMLVFSGLGMYRQKSKIMRVGVLLLAGGSIILSMLHLGVYSIAISMCVAQFVMSGLMYYAIKQRYPNFKLYFSDTMTALSLGFIGIIIGLISYTYFHNQLGYLMMGVILYVMIIGLTMGLRYEGLKKRYGDLFFV